MNEGTPTPPITNESREDIDKKELIALARELYESGEVFPFSGFEPEAYTLRRERDEEFPGYATPTDELLTRFKNEGMTVVLGKYPESGNIFILPAGSNDIERDMVYPKDLTADGVVHEKLRELITRSKLTSLGK